MRIMKKMLAGLLLSVAMLAAHAAVDVNKATQAELESIKGVGPATSTRILDERKKAAFRDWPDLIDRVKGIGPGNATKLSGAGLTVGGSPYTGGVPVKTKGRSHKAAAAASAPAK